jgi:hypothetical protein
VGQSTKRGWGQIYFFDIFYCVFELPSPRNAQNRDKKKIVKTSVLDFWSNFVKKRSDTMFFANYFLCGFELPSLRNNRKRDKTKKSDKTIFLSIFLEKALDMDFLQKCFNGVFELPLPTNAQKLTEKKNQGKKSRIVVGWVWDLANARGGVRRFVLPAPRKMRFGSISALKFFAIYGDLAEGALFLWGGEELGPAVADAPPPPKKCTGMAGDGASSGRKGEHRIVLTASAGPSKLQLPPLWMCVRVSQRA